MSLEGDFTSVVFELDADWLLVNGLSELVVGAGVGVGVGAAVGVAVVGLVSAAATCLAGGGVGEVACLGVLGLTGLNGGCVVVSRGEVLPLASPEPVFAALTGLSLGKLSVPGLVVLLSLGG